MPGYKELMTFLGTMCETEPCSSRKLFRRKEEVKLFTDIFPEGLPAGAKDPIICGGGVGGFTPRVFPGGRRLIRNTNNGLMTHWKYIILFWWSILFLIGLPTVSYIYGGMTPASSIWFMIRQWMN